MVSLCLLGRRCRPCYTSARCRCYAGATSVVVQRSHALLVAPQSSTGEAPWPLAWKQNVEIRKVVAIKIKSAPGRSTDADPETPNRGMPAGDRAQRPAAGLKAHNRRPQNNTTQPTTLPTYT